MPARAAALVLSLATLTAASAGATSDHIAQAPNRCSATLIHTLEDQIRGYDKQPPGSTKTAAKNRSSELDGVLRELNAKRAVVSSVCSTDVQKASLDARLSAAAAWALALQSDLAPLLTSCKVGAKAVQIAKLAQAWVDVFTAVAGTGFQAPPPITDVEHKVQTRAEAIGFALPIFDETSVEWRNNVVGQARDDAARACPR